MDEAPRETRKVPSDDQIFQKSRTSFRKQDETLNLANLRLDPDSVTCPSRILVLVDLLDEILEQRQPEISSFCQR
ncbi:MAG: hypothetical protein ACI915_001849 [Gammaproteobacteria bacterium]|jgi:hypothetical protein